MVVRRLAYILAVLLFCGAVPSPGWDGFEPSGESRTGTGLYGSKPWQVSGTFSRKDLRVFMTLAERSRDSSLWGRVLEEELPLAPEWEQKSILSEYEERLSRWIQREWGRIAPKASVEELARELDRANYTYVLKTDESGKVLFDGKGDPLFKGMDGFQADDSAWKQQVEAKREALLRVWEQQARTECQELLSSFSSSLKDRAEAQLSVCLDEYRKGVEREFDRLIQQSSTRFLQARLQDSFSLRRKSEGSTAEAIAVSLVTRTEEDLREAFQRMREELPSIGEGASEVHLDPSQWQEEFKREFERGVSAWKQAEERFFQERIRWETEAQNSYLASEKAWETAFEEFGRRREIWIGEMRSLLERGRKAWEEQQGAFIKEYKGAMETLASSARGEIRKFQEEVESRLSMYRKSLELVEMAEENGSLIQSELDRLSARAGMLNDEIATFQSEISLKESRIENILQDPPTAFRSYEDGEGVEYTILECDWAKRKWYGDFIEFLDDCGYELVWFSFSDGSDSQYYEPGVKGGIPWAAIRLFNEKAQQESLSSLRGEIQDLLDREVNPRIAEREGILLQRLPPLREDLSYWIGPGGIRDRFEATRVEALRSVYDLATEASEYGEDRGGGSPLDREIERVRQILSLEEEQLALAREVLAYAQDFTSNRPTEAETAQRMEQALAEFLRVEGEYHEALNRVKAHLTTVVGQAQQGVSRAKEELAGGLSALEDARKAYEEALSVYRSGNTAILSTLIEEYGRKISAYYGEGEGSRKEAWEKYIAGMEYIHRQEVAQQATQILRDLEGEGDFDEFPDLSLLRERTAVLQELSIPWAGEAEPSAFALQLTMAGVAKERVEELAELYRLGKDGNLLARRKGEAILEGIKQEASVSLFQAERIHEFLLREPMRAEEGEAYLEELARKERQGEVSYWLSRLRREREALSFLLDGDPEVGEEGRELAQLIRTYGDSSYQGDRGRLKELEGIEELSGEAALLDVEMLREAGSRSPYSRSGHDGESAAAQEGMGSGEEIGPGLFASEVEGLGGIDLVELYSGAEWLSWEKARIRLEVAREYASISRALAAYEGKSLSARIEEAIRGADRASPEGFLRFLQALPNPASIPPYLVEILGRVTALSIFSHGKNPDDFVQGTEGALAESVSYYLEGVEDAARSLGLKGGAPAYNPPSGDLPAYRNLLYRALTVFTQEGPLPSLTMEESRSRREAALGGEQEIQKWVQAKARLSEELKILQSGKELFKEQVLDRKQEELNRATQLVEGYRERYTEALRTFSLASQEYTSLLSQANEKKARYTEARSQKDKAEAIYQYASSGYALPGYTPEELVEERSRRVKELRWVADRLEDLQALTQDPFPQRMDPSYGAAMLQERSWMECTQYLQKAQETIGNESASLKREIFQVVSSMEYQIRKVFEFRQYRESGEGENLSFTIDPVQAESHPLSDLRTEDEAIFAQWVRAYFEGDAAEVSKRISTDAVKWMEGMVKQGDPKELLRHFGLAYYYDTVVQGDLRIGGAPAIVSSLLEDPSWNKLLDDYVDLGPVTVPIYEYSGDEATVVGYETYYPESLWTVEDYLERKTGELYRTIQQNGELWGLYSFFKMMMATQNMKGGTTYLGKDLGDLVFSHVDTLAEQKQKSYLKWWRFWTNAEGRRIRALRQDIAQVHDTGCSEREDFSRLMEGIVGLEAVRVSRQRALNSLTSQGHELTLSGFLSLLEEKTGSPVDPAWARTIGEVFQTVDEGQRRDSFSFLEAVQRGILSRAGYSQKVAQDRATQLSNERVALYDRYRSHLEQVRIGTVDGSMARMELENLLESLYQNPSFTWEDHFAYRLEMAKTLPASTRKGWAHKLNALAEGAVAMFRGRMETIQEQERQKALGELSLLKEKQQQWEAQMQTLFQTGTNRWKEQAVRLYGMRKRWQEEYAAEFEERRRLWEGKYELLVRNRQTWVERISREAVTAGSEGMSRQFGLERDRLLSELDQVRIPDLSFERYGTPQETLRRIVQDAFGGQGMDAVLAQASWLTGRIGKEKPILTVFLPGLRDTSETLKQAERFAEGIGEEIYRKASLVAALQMGKVVEEAQSDVKGKILEANQGVEKSVIETLRGAGYKQDGKLFVRRAVIDETLLGGIEREKQEIEGYRYFQAPSFRPGVDLSRSALEGRNGDYIQAMVMVAQRELSRYLELVFGRNKDADWTWEGVETLKEIYLQAEQAYRNSSGYGRRGPSGASLNQADGLFHWHVGYAPEMDPGNPEAVKEEGYGEMGRIYTLFFRNQARQQKGLASFDVAWYNRKLWDDDRDNDGKSDGLFGSPTIRSLTNIAVSVASAAFLSPWAATALNLADDLLFTGMDMGNGSLRWDRGMKNLVKQAGLSALSTGIGLGGASLDRALDFGKGVEGALLEVGTDLGITALKSTSLSYGSRVVEALTEGKSVGLLDWNDAGSTLGIELLRTGVQSGLQTTLRGYLGQTLATGTSLNTLVGNLSSNALEYALRGTTQFNLVNAQMFSGDVSGGLLEFTLGGEGGSRFSLGQGGTDISLGALSQSLKGFDAYYQNYRLVKEGIRDDLATAMRVLYGSGEANGRTLYEEILSGKTRVVEEQNADFEARTDWDREKNQRVVRINTAGTFSREGKNSDLELGVVLSHEAFRNGRDDGEELQRYETERAVMGHMAVASQVALAYGEGVLNDKLRREVALFNAANATGSMETLKTYISQGYESSKDYWKLLRDGTLINDGKGRLLMEILNDDGTRGWQLVEGSEQEHSPAAALVHYLGMKRATELLGKNPLNIDLYDSQTLKDVLNVSDQEIQMMQRNPTYARNRLAGINADQLEKLMGEALMKRAGIQWDVLKGVWEGEGTGIRITSAILPGSAAIRSLGVKEYERFSVTTEILRQEGAYSVWMNGKPGPVGAGNTSIVVRKWDLDSGRVVQSYAAEGAWNSVDNSYGQRDRNGNPIGVNQPYQFVSGPLVQGNTLAPGALNLRWAQSDSRNFKEVLIMSDTKTISGERILSSGFGEDHPHEGKWLIHYTGYGTSDGCIVSVGEESMKKLMTALKSMGVTRGYVISSRLEDRNQFVRGPGYKKGNW